MIKIFDNFADESNYWHNRIKHNVAICYHTTEGSAEGALAWSKNPKSNVSFDYLIGARDVIRNVPEGMVAWTQGVRDGDERSIPHWYDEQLYGDYNGCFIGIEVAGYHNQVADEDTYRNLVDLVEYLCEKYEIPLEMEYHWRHSELSKFKKDPGIAYDPDNVIADILARKDHIIDYDHERRIARLEEKVSWLTETMDKIGDATYGSHP